MSELRRIGSRYQVDSLLGRGSTGQVWRGCDEQGTPFAFKVLRPELAEDTCVVHQFMQERAVLQSIRHPNVVGVHDLVVEGSTLAIVMDLVEGSDLRAVLSARGTLPPAEVARFGARLAGALGAAHDAGIAHRDLKPENVLVDGTTGDVRLTDFGIAALMDASSTTPQRVAGTPQYMAPEVADGYVGGHSGDLYSLGVVVYELCCGATPFAGRGSALATMKAHATDVPRRPEGIPDPLWAVISELLAKSPEDRPASASVVEARLEALRERLAGIPAAERITSTDGSGSSTVVLDDRTVWGMSSGRAALHATPDEVARDDEWGDDRPRRRLVLVAAAAGLVIAGGVLAWAALPDGSSDPVGEVADEPAPTAPARPSRGGLAASPAPVVSPSAVPTLAEVTMVPPGAGGAPGVVPTHPGGGSGTAMRGHRSTPVPSVGRTMPPASPTAPTSLAPAPGTGAPDIPTTTAPPVRPQSAPAAAPTSAVPPAAPSVAPPAATEPPAVQQVQPVVPVVQSDAAPAR